MKKKHVKHGEYGLEDLMDLLKSTEWHSLPLLEKKKILKQVPTKIIRRATLQMMKEKTKNIKLPKKPQKFSNSLIKEIKKIKPSHPFYNLFQGILNILYARKQ